MISLPNTSTPLLDQLPYSPLSPENPLTPFSNCYAACQSGDLKQVKSLLTLDPSLITQSDAQGQTLLYACAAFNQLPVMQWLYEQNPLALKMCRFDGKTLMHIAAEKGHLEIVEWLHEKDSTFIDQADNNQLTPLHEAAFHEEISILKLFITKLKINYSLIQQIAQKNCPKTLAFLLEQGIDPNHSNSSQQTLLHLAAEAGQEKNVLCLIQHEAKVDACDCSKRTPLFLAVMQNHRSIVMLLIQNKADLTAVNEEQETLLHVAAAYGHQQLLGDLLSYPVCKSLIEAKDLDGKTALHKAVWGDPKPAIITLLIEHGANANAKNIYGYTPLHWAAKHGHIQSAQCLLDSGSSIEIMNSNDYLPFDLAVKFSQDNFLQFLVNGNSSKDALNQNPGSKKTEQILDLLKLGVLYYIHGIEENFEENEEREKSLFISAKILNSIFPLLNKTDVLLKAYLFKRLEEHERFLLTSLKVNHSSEKSPLKEIRARLENLKERVEISYREGQPVQQAVQSLTDGFKQIFTVLVLEVQQHLGPVPIKQWACIGIGAIAKGEISPFWGVEFAFLVEKDTPEALEYFRKFAKILELKMVNIGATQQASIRENYESIVPNEFRISHAIGTAADVPIGTPKQLAELVIGEKTTLAVAMTNVFLITGEKKLKTKYDKKKKELLLSEEKIEGAKRKNSHKLALRHLRNHVDGFVTDLSIEKGAETTFSVNDELYYPLQHLLDCLYLLHDLKEKDNTNSFDKIEQLRKYNVFSDEGAHSLKRVVEWIISLQLELGFFYKGRQELLYYPHAEKTEDCLFYFNQENFEKVHESRKIVFKLHDSLCKLYLVNAKPQEIISKRESKSKDKKPPALLDFSPTFGEDHFIPFFLRTKPKLPSADPSKDLEKWYADRLMEAKKQNFLEEQILCLEKLSTLYVNKKDFLKGVKILNCAIALLEGKDPLFENYLIKKLEEIEELFLKCNGVNASTRNTIKNKRIHLAKFREIAKASYEEQKKPIQEILSILTNNFKEFLSTFILEAQNLLGPPPVQWACIGMGSMSRGEMCPYSDIEFAFLIEDDTEEAFDYFRTLSKIIELEVINLGETKYPIFGFGHDSPTPDGFCMDSGGNTPLGKPGLYELIGTPKQLALFQSFKKINEDIILPNAMSNVCLINGNEKLEAKYNEEKKKVQQLKEMKKEEQRENGQELAMRLLGGHLIEFPPDLSKEKEKETAFGVKKELYRPFQEIIGCLSLWYDLKEKSTIGRIDELAKLHVFSLEGAENLKKAINQVLALRLQVHLFYKDEKEFLCHPEQEKPQDPHLYYFNEQNLKDLHEIYKVLLPFHKAASEFYRTHNKEALNTCIFYDDSPFVQGVAFEKTLQYAKAQEAYQQAVSLNPNDVDVLLHLGVIEYDMGKSQDVLPRCLKALEIARHKYGENHPDVTTSFNNIGAAYQNLGEYDKALEFHQKALKIQLLVLGENHPNVATDYNNIGNVYDNLGDYAKALEFYQKALKIRLQVFGENHPYVATSYNNIGLVYNSLGDYDNALEFDHKALKIKLLVLGENHPDLAISYNNIGEVYRNIGDYDNALEFSQKALKIKLLVFGENHPDVARSYNNIGCVYYNLGDYDKALEFYQKTMKIWLQVLGEKHPDVARSYNNIGLVYKALGDYGKALEFCQNALKIWLQVFGENHPDVATSYNNIGLVNKNLGDYNKALEFYQKALKIRLQVLGENHPDVATSYNNIGLVNKNLGDYNKALEFYQKALKIRLQVLGENHPDVATSYNNIGSVYYSLGDYEKALNYFRIAVEIWCKIYKQFHQNILTALQNLIFIAEDLQLSQCQSLKPTYALCLETLGAEHELTKKLLQLIKF